MPLKKNLSFIITIRILKQKRFFYYLIFLILSCLVSSRLVSSRLVSSRLVSSPLLSSPLLSSPLLSSPLLSSPLLSSPLLSSPLLSSPLLSSPLLSSPLLSSPLLSSLLFSSPIPSCLTGSPIALFRPYPTKLWWDRAIGQQTVMGQCTRRVLWVILCPDVGLRLIKGTNSDFKQYPNGEITLKRKRIYQKC